MILENNGVNVNQFRKLEIKLTVVHAGLSELLKLSLIDGVLPVDRKIKLDYQPNNY